MLHALTDFLCCGVYRRVADDESSCSEPAGCEPACAMTNPMSAEAIFLTVEGVSVGILVWPRET